MSRVPIPATLRHAWSPAVVQDLDAHIAAHVAAALATKPSPYMTTEEAAAYLRCDRGRIHDLTRLGRLTRHKEGRRVLLLREEVEALVSQS